VAIISETTARQFFSNEDPIGKRITEKGQIVGVVGDVKYTGLADAMQPAIYEPLSQAPSWDVFLSVKTDVAGPVSLAAASPGELKLLDAEVARYDLERTHPSTLISMNYLADTLRAQGDTAGARKVQEEALAVGRRVWGPSTRTLSPR